jgi:diguanylate cyclase (GGDEF)-like protein
MQILIADDDRLSLLALEGCLRRWGDDVVAVADGAAAWEALQRPDGPRLAVLDWEMPGLDGLEVCRRCRARAAAAGPARSPYTYLLLLTGRRGRDDLVAGLDAGADDYLTKPLDAVELRARLQAGRRVVRLHEELLAAQAELREKALRDPLTGLFNRGAVLEVLGMQMARSARDGWPLAVVLFDLDHFKRVNDTLGHAAGDAVLVEVARRVSSGLRGGDGLGRIGGEEFLAVLPSCNMNQGRMVGERMRRALAAGPVRVPGGAVPVTLSAGVAVAAPGTEVSVLLQAADAALYHAKAAGRDRISAASAEPYPLAPVVS